MLQNRTFPLKSSNIFLKTAIQIFVSSLILLFTISSCKKESVSTSNAFLFTSADSLHFDTVFTGTLSPTQSFKIFNPNASPITIRSIHLGGGPSSPFKINVNGMSASGFSNIQIAANDSIYVFVSLNVNANAQSLPFIVQDSILIDFSSFPRSVYLDGYGQNAFYLNNASITKDTTWDNKLPVVINGPLIINENATLTILKGVQVYCHADAAVQVFGRLRVYGEPGDSMEVNFRGDRLDEPYNKHPGSWPGLVFHTSSSENELYYTNINYAVTGIEVQAHSGNDYKLKLFQCKVQNILGEGIKAVNTSLYAQNCLITNCGGNNLSLSAGNYDLIHCTFASYSTQILNHLQPIIWITDLENGRVVTTRATFTNCIIYGESGLFEDEIALQKTGNEFQVSFTNCLFKGSGNAAAKYVDCIQNADPYFTEVNKEDNQFDFHLSMGSPCIDAGKPTVILNDLEADSRTNLPDIGCYESK